jgi:probable phosphoglycerate mutase
MSALQCPARVFVARPGDAEALAAALRAQRIARVWCGPLPPSVQTAETVAAVLGVDVVVREDLRELRVAGRPPAVLEEIADQYRGEAVLVVGDDLTLPDAGHVELEVDADGWRLVRRDAAD